ncbi:HUWE1-associated protein modifying stress responses-like [Watersipora subatra]|uniref:HUWE1-associated protein modifying stress responses-like n=1 Tax=Watersipora subatra TaxID=2589382 RepID=UPI00355BA703
MDGEYDRDADLPDNPSWSRTAWEDHLLEDFTGERDALDQQSKFEQEAVAQQLWLSFQNSASAVANLYKGCLQEDNCWSPFQNAAGAVTVLYKDAMEVQKRNFERGVQCGHNKRMRDLLTWVKKKRRHIRREELIAFICGKPPPVRTQRHSPPRCRLGSRSHSDRSTPRSPVPLTESEPDLTPFQNALAIQGLDGAMSSVSMGYSAAAKTKSDELNVLIMDGLTRHNESRKRSSATLDGSKDSPNRKRNRFL